MSTASATVKKAPHSGGVRYAPSPTGRFHVGNLRTAWISYQWAKRLKLPWVVRFEDIDQPRVLSGAREQQLSDLQALGLIPDLVLTQSEFRARHWECLLAAIRTGQVYPCDCSRKEVQTALAGLASAPHDGLAPVYSGRCRTASPTRAFHAAEKSLDSLAWRFRMSEVTGHDDFIIARSGIELDNLGLPREESFVPAYHWACAIDDFDGGYELLVRSSDLLPAATLQFAIHKWLAGATPSFSPPAIFHTALITQNDGHRLEKRTRGVTLPELAQSGVSTENLLRLFASGYREQHDFMHGALMNEKPATLTLAQLGLSS